jgi:hypothetical protein
MSVINNNLLLTAPAAGSSSYQVSRSLRFNSADSAYLNRTPASASNRRTWTWAGWVKKASVGGTYVILGAASDSNNFMEVRIANEQFQITFVSSGVDTARVSTAQVLRDPSAWYHLLAVLDTTQATASNRAKLYINGSAVTQYSGDTNYPVQNTDWNINSTNLHSIGSNTSVSNRYFNGYLAEVHFINGQALDPSSFTETNATTGQLIPKAYTGSYGTNGFKLNFSSNSTTAALGTDTSSNGNTWTVNNLSVTAGSGNDSLVDTPTSYGTDTGVGGEVRGNYATLNPLLNINAGTYSNGNLDYTATNSGSTSSIGVSSGKWYYEGVLTVTSGPGDGSGFGIRNAAGNIGIVRNDVTAYFLSDIPGLSSITPFGTNFTVGDIIGIAFDANAGTLNFTKNGAAYGSQITGIPSDTYTFYSYCRSSYSTSALTVNFGQRPFAYTAPSGFKALCDTNLPSPLIAKPNTVMDVALYTGTGSALTATSALGFSPDFVWIKGRSGATDHALYDAVRGATLDLVSNSTAAETTQTQGLTAFNSNGFSVGTLAKVNTSSATYAAWAWDAGTSTVTNTAGSITSQVRANASAGFSVVTYTGTGSAGATVGHGLGVQPQFLIIKCRDTAGDPSWIVSHTAIGLGSGRLILNGTQANSTTGAATLWNSTAPTSSVFSLGDYSSVNGSTLRFVAYCFAPVAGYSAMGSYVGNGSTDGVFVYTGFRPRWVMIKASSSTGDWYIIDTARDTYNLSGKSLQANSSNAEPSIGGSFSMTDDILSNGFKLRDAGSGSNGSGVTYVYAAFAENPFQYARAR